MRKLVLLILLSVLCVSQLAPARAKKNQKNEPPPLNEQIEQLLRILANKPQLMNLDYLEAHIGHPEDEYSQQALSEKKYDWYDAKHNLLYELRRDEGRPGQITEATFTANLENEHFKPARMVEYFGEPNKEYYDSTGQPCEGYYAAPGTMLSFVIPNGKFKIQQAVVAYRGTPLPLPRMNEIYQVHDANINEALAELDKKNWRRAEVLFARCLQAHPDFPPAQLGIAKAYRGEGRLNDAISEYRVVLNNPQSDPTIREQSSRGLEDLHVMPRSAATP